MGLFSKNPEPAGDNYKWTVLAVASLGTLVGILTASTLIINGRACRACLHAV